MITCDHADSAE